MAVLPTTLAVAAPDAAIDVLHVVEWGDHAPMVRGPHGSPAVDFKKLWEVARQEAEKELDKLLEGREGASRMTARTVEGDAATAILEEIERGEHQLLVVGRTDDAPPRHEHVSERVIRHATCPVLVARHAPSNLRSV